jgi:N-acetylmuramoyl-L-alanine amidase
MVNRFLVIAGSLLFMAADPTLAATAKSMYTSALAREQAVRAALKDDQTTADLLVEMRALVAEYETIVRRFPASGYCDDALWQAGRLSLDAFARFGQQQDKTAGLRLLRALTMQYPSSALAGRVPELLATLGESDVAVVGTALQASPRLATIKRIQRAVLPDAVRVTIELDAEVVFHDEWLEGPARVFLDLRSTRAAPALQDRTLRFDGDGDVVHQVRVGRHPNSTTRVVLDATGVSSYSVYPLYAPYRLVIDCVRPAAADGSAAPLAPAAPPPLAPPAPPPLLAKRATFGTVRGLPSLTPHAIAAIAEARLANMGAPVESVPIAGTPARATAPPSPATPPSANINGGFSIARQLGLGVSRIVIDPGHGGHDPGAKGTGITEAELVLDVGLRLEKLLRQIPGVEVILTRRTDEFVPLPERTAIANREGADLFLSIHANASSSPQTRGIETYFLNFASNLSAAAVAARENAASGQAMGALPDLVKAIALNNKLDESRDFATDVQRAMIERLRGTNKLLKDLGVKQAPFVVLIGAAMPSVLAEISFVTNPQEAKLLRSGPYRQRIAEALLGAIRKYQASLQKATTIAQP